MENYNNQTPPPPPASTDTIFTPGPSGRSRGVAGLLAIFLGGFGVQYFYLGKVDGGLLAILLTIITCGLFEIVFVIQGIVMMTLSQQAFERTYFYNTKSFPLF